jgi:NAD(P)-dependent dehydrogenase (short-subunit alcohol dehydrogenase family)
MGRSIALELAKAGARLVVNDVGRAEEAREVVAEIRSLGGHGIAAEADVTDLQANRTMVEEAVARFGGLDILVNNAGHGLRKPFGEISEAEYDFQLDLHLKAPFFLAQAVVPHMRRRGGGRIVNISSELAYIGCVELTHYSAAKAGLIGLTKALALELAPLITVNAVCPGPTATDKFKQGPEFNEANREKLPLKRWGTPVDVARSVLFLVSPDGDAFTGQTLDPNSGAVMH